MKKSLLCMAACAFMLHTQASATQTTPVLMPQFGKQVINVQPGDTLTYLDYMGYGKMTDRTASSAFATTIFRPAQEGYRIYIDFDTVHVVQVANSNPSCLKIYNGVFDTLSVTYPTAYTEYTKTVFPYTASQLDSLTISSNVGGLFRHKTYLSTDPTGALSCCFSFGGARVSFGWNAKVYALPDKAQTVTAVVPDYSKVATDLYAGKTNVSLAAFSLLTEGAAPVDTLTGISFTLTDKTVFDPALLRLYTGNAERTVLPTPSHPYTGISTQIETTFAEANGVYTLTCKQPLELADNIFCIGGDVLSSAPWDAVSAITITSVSTKKGSVSLAATTPVAQKVQATVALEEGKNQVIDVNRTDIRFYDNGSVENKYTNQAQAGCVTFRPATTGMRVQLDFLTIAIASRDTLCVYSGTETTDANLLYTGKNGDRNIRIKSLAADGALTVRFATKATDQSLSSYNGWEATLCEFEPKDMVITSSAVTKETATPVCGTKNVQVLHFVLSAENTEQPLQPREFGFNTNGTFAAIDSVKLYYTGNSSKFATTNLLAETDVTANEFTLTPAAMDAFKEGEHHFFVTADISDKAATDDLVDINIDRVVFTDNSSYRDFNNPVSGVKVLNSIASVCDEHTYTISGKWQFTHTAAKAEDWPTVVGGYTMEICDQISTFKPATANAKLQMEFSLFDIFYANDPYGFDTNKAQFVIYNGSNTDADVLFEVNDLASATTLPATVTSTAADGSLTVFFNANPSFSGYNNAGGWKATLSEVGGQSTAVPAVSADNKAVKYITPDGQLLIHCNGILYNASGIRIR